VSKKAFLIFVEFEGINSNKYYNMELVDSTIHVEYGRVGSTKSIVTYPASKWDSLIRSKVKKGYKDITDLKREVTVVVKKSDNKPFNEFYDHFAKYTGDFINKHYNVEGCTKSQIDEAQKIINHIVSVDDLTNINKSLVELFKIIPRKMDNVKDYLLGNVEFKNSIITREQTSLDSMDSMNIINTENPFDNLDIEFEEVDFPITISTLINKTNSTRYKPYKCYRIVDKTNITSFNEWANKQDNKNFEHLIHGTRNPNVFNILKTGLLIRPSNAAVISGAAYGEGVYHSAHAAKSMNYTGSNSDKIFFIQNVHMGKPYTYNGWYTPGKDLDRSKMNYKDLKGMGYDSLYVKPGDGLQNSEYIVYNKEQTITDYLVWLK